VEISATSGVRPDWTFSVPNKRSYAPVLREYDGVMVSFVRPVADGRALSVSSGAREVLISAVPSSTILGKLIEEPGWSARQTPGGVFVTRFIERLGGPGSTVANQPGARAALLEVARSERGRPSGAIVQSIKDGRAPGLSRWRATPAATRQPSSSSCSGRRYCARCCPLTARTAPVASRSGRRTSRHR